MKKLLKQLVIDTATNYIFLSLIIDGKEASFRYEEGINNHSVTIIPYLDEILKENNISLKEIDEVIVGVGPGSYTGVRIGVTVAKMIGHMNKIKVYTTSSLSLLASNSSSSYVLALVDARRGNAFMALYQNIQGKMDYIFTDKLDKIEKVKSELTMDYETITSGKPDVIKVLNSNLIEYVDDINDLVPNYLQVTEAERNLKNAN